MCLEIKLLRHKQSIIRAQASLAFIISVTLNNTTRQFYTTRKETKPQKNCPLYQAKQLVSFFKVGLHKP